MGRGRAKAKQAKVARKLKYSSPTTDFEQLQRELSSSDDSRSDLLEEDRSDSPGSPPEDDDRD